MEIGTKIIEDAIAPEPYHNLTLFDLYQLGSMYYTIEIPQLGPPIQPTVAG